MSVFPTVFSSSLVQHEFVANYSHLFRVQGSQPDLEPYLLLAHIDVVPAAESDGWEAPPFSAKEIDDFIYGRGTIDNKSPVMVRDQVLFLCLVLFNRTDLYTIYLILILYALFLSEHTSGTGVLTDKRLYTTQRILHRSWT